jgi:hypothetical protein
VEKTLFVRFVVDLVVAVGVVVVESRGAIHYDLGQVMVLVLVLLMRICSCCLCVDSLN